jgi:uncharacterized repeat protein (TIGR01451 family)
LFPAAVLGSLIAALAFALPPLAAGEPPWPDSVFGEIGPALELPPEDKTLPPGPALEPPPGGKVLPPGPALAPPLPAEPPVPVVAIRVRVPACVPTGAAVKYHICVENCSKAAAHHVLVRNPLPANARFVKASPKPSTLKPELRWKLGTMHPGERRIIVLVLQPKGPGKLKNCARVQFEHGQCVCTRVGPLVRGQIPEEGLEIGPRPRRAGPPKPALRFTKKGPGRAVLYDALTYQLTVTNRGNTRLTEIKVTDALPDGLEHASGKSTLSWDVEALAAGQERTIEYQVVAKKVGKLCNQATVTAADGLRKEAKSCVVVGEPKLALAKAGPARRYTNIPVTYLLTVSNPGSAPAANVVVRDPLPGGMTFVRAGKRGRLAGGEVRWTLGTLEPGTRRTLQVVLRAKAAGKVTNRATATADRGLTASATAVTEFKGVSALLIDVVDTVDPVEVGRETSYVISVKNQGSVPATGIRVTAQVPPEMSLVRAKGPARNKVGDRNKQGQTITFEPLKALAPGATVTYELVVKAGDIGKEPFRDVRFKADVAADQLKAGGPVHEEESTTIFREDGE